MLGNTIMTDTDSEMMRRQQNMDTRQTIEGEGRPGPADLNERDGRDRRQALAGRLDEPGSAAESQDDVLRQNTRDAGHGQGASEPGKRRAGGLVRKGRSLLGA